MTGLAWRYRPGPAIVNHTAIVAAAIRHRSITREAVHRYAADRCPAGSADVTGNSLLYFSPSIILI